ncbi:hypothetical protein BC830DRAFT_87391 [Chytriomyces sp. MP71]|nr:hypothetical protein BC830DRAFT_87391 [Chytriomyces sp. MP71]
MDAAELRAYADQLDPLMRHLLIDSLFDTIQNGTHVVFFGAAWCPYTQQYTPVWLNAQDQLAYHHPSTRLQMHKISCQDAQHKCFHYMRERDNAYPTVVLFRDGDYIEEVIDRDRVWEYIDLLARGGMNGPLSAGEVVKVERAVGLDFLRWVLPLITLFSSFGMGMRQMEQ